MNRVALGGSIFNRKATTIESCNNLYIQNDDSDDFRVIAVDDASTDGVTEVLKAFAEQKSNFQIIHSPKEIGCAKCDNLLLKILENGEDHICSCLDTKINSPHWISKLRTISKYFNAVVLPFWPQCTLTKKLGTVEGLEVYEYLKQFSFKMFYIPYFVIEQLGGFCEDYGIWGLVDVDYIERCYIAQIPIVVVGNLSTEDIGTACQSWEKQDAMQRPYIAKMYENIKRYRETGNVKITL